VVLSKYILEMLLVSKVEQSSSAQVHRALQVVVISVLLLDVEPVVQEAAYPSDLAALV
jgi:hypothetical protein